MLHIAQRPAQTGHQSTTISKGLASIHCSRICLQICHFIAIIQQLRIQISPTLRYKIIVQLIQHIIRCHRQFAIQLSCIIGTCIHPRYTCVVKCCLRARTILSVRMLIIPFAIRRNSETRLHTTRTYHMITHLYRATIHRSLFTR